MFYINISTFLSGLRHEEDDYYSYDLREPARKIVHPNKLKKTNKTFVSTDDWRNIPYYSKQQESLNNVEKDNIEMVQYITNIEREMSMQKPSSDLNRQIQQPSRVQGATYRPRVNAPINVFSQEYARQINQRSLASPSARIRLGGVM